MENNQDVCRHCSATIYWQLSKAGKRYKTNSERRNDFHNCEQAKPATALTAQAHKATLPPTVPMPPVASPTAAALSFEASLEERVGHLEGQMARVIALVREIRAAQPITSDEIPF